MNAKFFALVPAISLLVACGGTPSSSSSEHEATAGAADEDLSWLGSNPLFWQKYWDAKYWSELQVSIEPASPQPPFSTARTVILIPGTSVGGEFFAPMAARLRRDGFDPVVWTTPDLFSNSLATDAQRIGDEVNEVMKERGVSHVSIVAECDAGVSARYYAQVLGGAAHLDQLVTFVSAHHGTYSAPAGNWVTGWQALQDVEPGSEFMNELNGSPFPSDLKLTSIYTCHDEYLWPQDTSYVDGATNVEFCNQYLSHFQGFWDATVYERIRASLRGEGDSAPTQY